MKKRIILWVTSAFLLSLGSTALADESLQNRNPHMMNKSHEIIKKNSRMMVEGHNMKHEHMNNENSISPLVKSKKSQFTSKKTYFTAHTDKVPGFSGHTMFRIKLKNATGNPLSPNASVKGSLRMPGMEMDLPPVKVKHKKGEHWMLNTSIPMAGLWKIDLIIKDQGIQDKLTIKFITK